MTEPVVDDALRETHRDHRAGSQMGRPVQRVVLHFVARHDAIEDAHCVRLVGAHLPAAPNELLGARRTHEAREALRAARSGQRAEEDLRLADPRALRSHPQVTREGELASAAERVAADGGDHRTRYRRDRIEGGTERVGGHARPGLVT